MTSPRLKKAGFLRRRFWRWINRRLPPQREITLDRFRLFVFPSLPGFVYLLLCLLVWLLGTNYDNNLALLLTYLLVSLFVVAILHTFNNLSGLTLTALGGQTAFAGEDVELEVLLSRNGKRRYENIQLGWSGGSLATVDVIDSAEQRVKLFVPTTKRGWFNPGRLLVVTHYPLGLIRVWTWLDLDIKALVYPAPVAAGAPPPALGQHGDGEQLHEAGAEDFSGLKDYQPGHSLRHVAWKQYARGRGLYLKEYADYLASGCWLDWDALEGLPREERLSRLCHWVIEMAKTPDDYGLRLPGEEVAPAAGLDHKHRLLRALALFH